MGQTVTVRATLKVSVMDGFGDLRHCISGVEVDPASVELVGVEEYGSDPGRMPMNKVMAGMGDELNSHMRFLGPYDHIESCD
jgi:hypothetical protein